jgi:hypothetical protein
MLIVRPLVVALSAGGSTADQTALPLVDQNVGDDRGLRRLHATAGFGVAIYQSLKSVSPGRGAEQGLEFLFPLSEGFLRNHRFSSPKEDGRGGEFRPAAAFAFLVESIDISVPLPGNPKEARS